MNRAVFLDRDNTIIHNDGDLGEPEKVRLIQGAATAIASLCGLGYKVVVVTNQGGVARGLYSEDDVMLVHERIAELVREAANGARIDRFYYCPYHPQGVVDEYRSEHPSRKPAPGMILEAASDLNIDLSLSWTIGDQERDVQAGHAAGTRTILLRPDAEVVRPPSQDEPVPVAASDRKGPPDYTARNLTEAVRIIAHARRPEAAEHLHHAHVVGKRFDAATVAKLQQQSRSSGGGGEGGESVRVEAEAHERRTAGKPFRPWSNMPGEGEGQGESDRGARVRSMFRRLRAERSGGIAEPTADDAGGAPTDAASAAPIPTPGPGVTSKTTEGRGVTEARDAGDDAIPEVGGPGGTGSVAMEGEAGAPVEGDRADPPPTEPGELSVRPRPTGSREPSPPWHAMDHTLRLVLQELRNQRGAHGDFSYLYVLAIVLQMIAAVCLLGGLWMGSGDDFYFLRWIATGLMLQLATIAALLFERG
jgi:D,D-heptose 1,7-bisphosphate phosphatase